ncbi:hypothetical protein COLO4_03845 [Corchorus olitorius]|uniref:DYW domain-containing protein n=1 Tax=Corchorus olitorius TaxID=93759 RepID=A0A1R3KWF1_9ROSI|nr:hypothetical protein COLO4_03845 [Corchorus olitorius]
MAAMERHGIFADSITYSELIKCCLARNAVKQGLAQNSEGDEALNQFKRMKRAGFATDQSTLTSVLRACTGHAGLVDDGWNYFQSMKRHYGIDPGREHYGCIIDLLGRAGKLDEAVKLIQEMKCEPDATIWRTLLGACRVHRNVDLAIYAAEQVLKLDPEDAGTYVLLSNIFANSQRWEDVSKVRRAMKDKGIAKEPGCSWIEVNKQIHAFVLGDTSHPKSNEINWRVNQLIHKLMGIGYVPDTNYVLQDLEGEQRDDSLRYHSEKLAIVFGLMSLPMGSAIRIRKNLRICGDCHTFAKLVAKMENRLIVIRDPIRYHHFQNGVCSCGDYW